MTLLTKRHFSLGGEKLFWTLCLSKLLYFAENRYQQEIAYLFRFRSRNLLFHCGDWYKSKPVQTARELVDIVELEREGKQKDIKVFFTNRFCQGRLEKKLQ